MGPAGKHQWDVTLGEVLSNNFLVVSSIPNRTPNASLTYAKSTYLGIVLMCPILMVVKLTFFLLYLETFRPMRWLRLSVYVGTVSLTLFYGAYSIGLFVIATPTSGQTWQVHTFSSIERSNAYTAVIYLAAGGLGFDLYLLALPIGAIMQLQLPLRRKVGVTLIFMTGILCAYFTRYGKMILIILVRACLASLLSIYYRVVDNTTQDTTWNILNVGLMAYVLPTILSFT